MLAFFTNSTTDSVIFERHGKVIVFGLKLSPNILVVTEAASITPTRLAATPSGSTLQPFLLNALLCLRLAAKGLGILTSKSWSSRRRGNWQSDAIMTTIFPHVVV